MGFPWNYGSRVPEKKPDKGQAPNLSGLLLLSSNPKKLAEYRDFGLSISISRGDDLPEVDGSPEDVILHKSLAAGPGTLLEDTILEISGKPVIDIRWKVGELDASEGAHATFVVSLALNDGFSIRVWRARIEGTLSSPAEMPQDAFGFDPFFVPHGAEGMTLHELTLIGRKSEFSARALVVQSLLTGNPIMEAEIDDIPPWTGKWQGGYSAPMTASFEDSDW